MHFNYYSALIVFSFITAIHYQHGESVKNKQRQRYSNSKVTTLVNNGRPESGGGTNIYIQQMPADAATDLPFLMREIHNPQMMAFEYFSSGYEPKPNSVYMQEPSNSGKGKDFTKATKATAGILIASLASKFILKLFTIILTKFPLLLMLALPAITSFYFLAGVLFGRLTAGLINPPQIAAAPATSSTTPSSVTTTTVSSGTTGTVSFFFGTNLSGNGATVSGPIGVCENFPAQADNQVQSLQLVAGTCIVVCDTAGCTGTCYRITGTTVVNDFGSFNNMISSFMFC